MGRCRRRMSSALTSFSLARIRFFIVIRLSAKRPLLVFPQMCVKPKKSNSPSGTLQIRVFFLVHRQLQLAHDLVQAAQRHVGVAPPAQDHEVSRAGESHPRALAEPDVRLSPHPAPIVQPRP